MLVICELLGVPYTDRVYFREVRPARSLHNRAEAQQPMANLITCTGRLTDVKRAEPTQDVISDLAAVAQLDDQAVAWLARWPARRRSQVHRARIDEGVLLLLTNADQRDILLAQPDRVDAVVEEMLRLAAPGGVGIPRYAHADIPVGDVVIQPGEAERLTPSVANRDPSAFPDPFDAGRSPNPHLSYGHGPRFCIGAILARVELRAVLGTLFRRLPRLRRADGLDKITLPADRIVAGVAPCP